MQIIHKQHYNNGTWAYYGIGDIMQNELALYLEDIPLKPNAVYTDPPWTDSNCKYWRTLARKQDPNINNDKVSYNDFLTSLKRQLPIHLPIFLEGSVSTKDIILKVFKNHNLNIKHTYYTKDNKPQSLTSINTDFFPNNIYDPYFVEECFQYLQKIGVRTVLDPCVGLGTSAKYAYKYHMNFIGFDLNQTRVIKTITMMNKINTKGEN